MNKLTDQTNFWLAWQATCSIKLCLSAETIKAKCLAAETEKPGRYQGVLANLKETVRIAKNIVNSSNRFFARNLKTLDPEGLSPFRDEAASWEEKGAQGCAFSLLEGWLYSKRSKGKSVSDDGTRQQPALGTIKGRAFKNYLFDDIAVRPGGMSKNLYGYLVKGCMRDFIKKSLPPPKEVVLQPPDDEPESDSPPVIENMSSHWDTTLPPDFDLEFRSAVHLFAKFVQEHRSSWDQDHWIALYCIVHLLKIGSPAVVELGKRGHVQMNQIFKDMRANLIASLRTCDENGERLVSDRALGAAFNDEIPQKLSCFMTKASDGQENPFSRLYAELGKLSGKKG